MQASEKLAQMYIDWRGVAIDFKAAEYWFEKAVRQIAAASNAIVL